MINIKTKFKENQTVWIIKNNNGIYETEEHKVIGFTYYPKDKILQYILDDDNFHTIFSACKENNELYNNYKEVETLCKSLNKGEIKRRINSIEKF